MPRRQTARRRHPAGFTLIELMVVIVILGLLAAIVTPRFIDNLERGKQGAAKSQIALFKTALQTFYLDQGFYPETLEALVTNPGDSRIEHYPDGGYLDQTKIPKDQWGNDFMYVSPGSHNPDYDISSHGRDGLEGGDGFDVDIQSWDM